MTLFIDALACFRLSLLLSHDAGPYRLISKLRSSLKREAKHNSSLRKSAIHEGVLCIRCDSVWFGLLIAPFAFYHDQLQRWLVVTGDIFLLSLALSALAILFNRMFPKR